MKTFMMILLILFIIGAIMGLSVYILNIREDSRFFENIMNLKKEDFEITISDFIFSNCSVSKLVRHLDTVKDIDGNKYHNIKADIYVNRIGFHSLRDSIYDDFHRVTDENYNMYKEYVEGYTNIDLKGWALFIEISNEAKEKYNIHHKYRFQDKKYFVARVNIPHLFSLESFSDEDIESIIMNVKEDLVRCVMRDTEKSKIYFSKTGEHNM